MIKEQNGFEFFTFSFKKETRNETMKNWGLDENTKVGDKYCFEIMRMEGDEIGMKFKKI